MTSPNPILKKYAIKRLMAEWRDYELSPSTIKKNINAAPLEENIFEWHGNLAPPADHPYYSGCIFHFVMHFPDDYPKQPPSIELKTGMAHSNIIPKHYQHGRFYEYFLCMDIINNFFWIRNNGQQLYRGWSSAYSIETLLLQLYTFLFEERVENYDGEIKQTLYQRPPELGGGKYDITNVKNNLTQAWNESKYYHCAECGHTYKNPNPLVTPSGFKEISSINLREPPSILKLIIKPNDFPLEEHRKSFNEIIHAQKSNTALCKILKLATQKVWPEIQKPYIEQILKGTFDVNTVTKYAASISCLFNNFKDVTQILDDHISPNIKYEKKQIMVEFDHSAHQLLGHCTPPNPNFLAPDLLNKLIGQFFENGFFLNDLIFIYDNLIPNKLHYWEELIDFRPLNPNTGRYVILKDSYIPPSITIETKTRARHLLSKLGQLLTAALINPHKYILSKWSTTIDELFELLDINTDVNQEIKNTFDIIKNQVAYKSASGCPYSCKTCYPHGPPVLENNSEFELPYAEHYNQTMLCIKWLGPKLFDLPKLIRPGNLDTLRNWYSLWLTRYSDIIIDNLTKWGYDFKGGLISKPTNQVLAPLMDKNLENMSPVLELSETAKREVLDALTKDGRLLLAGISNQFAVMLRTPEYKEKTWLKCWVTGYTLTDDVLGYPIAITTFAKQGGDSVFIKEITSTLDIMSLTAYSELKIDKSVWNYEFAFFLPLYLTPAHFKHARSQLLSSILSIYFTRGLNDKTCKVTHPPATIINEIFSTLLNSLVVEMMKGETHISLKALEGFTQLYRTWYYLAEADPEIRQTADATITNFMLKKQSRHKRVMPNLGKLLMLVCISRKYTWDKIQKEYFEESRDRNILWILRACPEIITMANWYDIKPYLNNVLDATIVGKRLQIFNKYFTEITKSTGFMDALDHTYGYPDEQIKQDFQIVMQKIYNMKTWDEYYLLSNIAPQTETERAHQIYWDIRNSTRKGYNIGIKGIGQVLGQDLELLKLFESNYSLEEILDFFKKFRDNDKQVNTIKMRYINNHENIEG